MTPMFIDLAVESLEAPPPMREPVSIMLAYPMNEDLVTTFIGEGDDIPFRFREIVLSVGGRALGDGSPANDLRLVGWDVYQVWQTLNGMLLRSRGPRLYNWHQSMYEKWGRTKFGDLRLIATQGWYCDFQEPFDKYANWLLGTKLASIDMPSLYGREDLQKAMEERVGVMADLWDKYTRGGKYA